MAETQSPPTSSGRRTKMSINFIAPGAGASRPPNLRHFPSTTQSSSSSSYSSSSSPPRPTPLPPLQSSSSSFSRDASAPSTNDPSFSARYRSGLRDVAEPSPSYLPSLSTSNMTRTTSRDMVHNQADYTGTSVLQSRRPSSLQIPETPYPASTTSTFQPKTENSDGTCGIDYNTPGNISTTTSNTSNPDSPATQTPTARQRAPRPCYSEEQKFFIMYSRIVLAQTWPAIEARFLGLFGQNSTRSKGGLTSVYYRVRKEWGLEDVLQSAAADSATEDQKVVASKAAHFSREVLMEIGYLSA